MEGSSVNEQQQQQQQHEEEEGSISINNNNINNIIENHVRMSVTAAAATTETVSISNNNNNNNHTNYTTSLIVVPPPQDRQMSYPSMNSTQFDGGGGGGGYRVGVSHEQQQEVFSILEMLSSAAAATAPVKGNDVMDNNCQSNDSSNIRKYNDDISNNHKKEEEQEEQYEGEYNSCEEEEENGKMEEEPSSSDADNEAVEIEGGAASSAGVDVDGATFPSRSKSMTRINSTVGGGGEKGAAMTPATSTLTTTSTTKSNSGYYYGKAKSVQSVGTFPELGSILGPFFCLGQLGKGTFSSIHKCINMDYFHNNTQKQKDQQENTDQKNDNTKYPAAAAATTKNSVSVAPRCRRLAAAKVELATFQQSGVLESEATILDYLHSTLPAGTVPVYMGHFKSEQQQFAAIFMEYLRGEDMHQLREHVMDKTSKEYKAATETASETNTSIPNRISPPTRRINVNDAVYLTADVMLPLLQRMHNVGVVHRDVKPSNCVRVGTGSKSKDFCLVDFGLSKSIIVPEDSEFADKQHYWNGIWLKPYIYQNSNCTNSPKGCYRQERKKAEFRGTSMYASLRVHQCRDYCPRDDVWSLLYVFCDLVTGGLPWMQHAANRDRDACQRYKERVHGEVEGDDGSSPPEVAELLKGDIYHKAVYLRERQIEAGESEDTLPPLPSPLAMCEESTKISLLTTAFNHVRKLQFWEKPDYNLIQKCIRGFAKGSNSKDPIIRPIHWGTDTTESNYPPNRRRQHDRTKGIPQWHYVDDEDPLDYLVDDIFEEHEKQAQQQRNPDDFMTRIPLQLRFNIEQMDYNLAVTRSGKGRSGGLTTNKVPIHRALHDWMQVTIELLYKEWDATRNEHGGHRSSTDGFRRDCYLQMLEKCRLYAKEFENFGCRDIIYFPSNSTGKNHSLASNKLSDPIVSNGNKTDTRSNVGTDELPPPKRRKIVLHAVSDLSSSSEPIDLLLVSKCIFGLEAAKKAEQSKKPAPPVRISFG